MLPASIRQNVVVLHCRCLFLATSDYMSFWKAVTGFDPPLRTMNARAKRWIKYLIAIIVGNLIYFSLEPHLPPVIQHRPYHADFGMFVDLWFCVLVYGLLEFLTFLATRIRR